jgi:hypothetical protein
MIAYIFVSNYCAVVGIHVVVEQIFQNHLAERKRGNIKIDKDINVSRQHRSS